MSNTIENEITSLNANKQTEDKFATFTLKYQKLIDSASKDRLNNRNYIDDYWGYSRWIHRDPKTGAYSREDIDNVLDSESLESKIKLSRYFFEHNGFYRRILLHYATILKYIGILIPNPTFGLNLSKDSIKKKYNNAVNFIDTANLPALYTRFAIRALRDGTYYGIISDVSNKGLVILDLPTTYCRSYYIDSDGNDVLEFNVSYFDTITDEVIRENTLSVYPEEVSNWYKRWKKGKVTYWCPVPAEIAIYLPLIDGIPTFLELIPAVLDYEESKAINKARDLNEIRKIIVQKIPHLTDGGLLFEPDEAEYIHKGTVNMLKDDANVSVLTTYADVDAIVAHSNNDNALNSVDKALKNVYAESGSSSQLFGTDSNLSLETSINNDMALMMTLVKRIDALITRVINLKFGKSEVSFIYETLPISYYNESKYIENALKLASSGYSFIIPSLAMGISQGELINVKDLENDVLKLSDKLIPLSTSYTQSGNSPGRPALSPEEKSEKTVANEISLDNGGNTN